MEERISSVPTNQTNVGVMILKWILDKIKERILVSQNLQTRHMLVSCFGARMVDNVVIFLHNERSIIEWQHSWVSTCTSISDKYDFVCKDWGELMSQTIRLWWIWDDENYCIISWSMVTVTESCTAFLNCMTFLLSHVPHTGFTFRHAWRGGDRVERLHYLG